MKLLVKRTACGFHRRLLHSLRYPRGPIIIIKYGKNSCLLSGIKYNYRSSNSAAAATQCDRTMDGKQYVVRRKPG